MTESTNRKRQPRGIPTGGEFAANTHDEANGSMLSSERETPAQIHERYERDAAETRAVIESYVESGLLTKAFKRADSDAPDEYSTGDIFIGRNADGDRIFVEYRAQVPTGKRPHGSMEDPSVLVDPVRFSMSGMSIEKGRREMTGGGQNSYELDRIVPSKDAALTPREAKELRALWDKNHLNDMNAGTHAQTAAVAEMPKEQRGMDFYTNALAHLEERGILEDQGYKYGSKWLSRSVPAEDVSRTLELLAKGKANREGTFR